MRPTTSSPEQATRIRRTFAWRSALVFVVVGIAAQLVINGIVADQFERSLEFHAGFTARVVVEPLLPPAFVGGGGAEGSVVGLVAELTAEAQLDPQVTAIEVVGTDGDVVLGDDLDRIGRRATEVVPDGQHLTRVPVSGRPDVRRIDVLQDRAATDAEAGRMRGRFAVLLLAGLLLLWLVLLPVAHRVGVRLQERTEEVEDQRAELARLLDNERETTRRLAEVNQLKDSFLTAISHELRTPLTVVTGMVSTLRQHGEKLPAERRQDMLERAEDNARDLQELVTGLLELNEPQRPNRRSFTAVDLAEVVAEVRSRLPPHDVELDLDAPTVIADRFALGQVLGHLLGNAVRHAPGSPVRLESETVHDGVELRVADRGPGVPDDLKQAIYEPFRQGELRDAHAPGTGIGLALVARLVGSHGGCTWVSDRPGGGAVFHVRMPDDPARQEPVVAQAAVCTHAHSSVRATSAPVPS